MFTNKRILIITTLLIIIFLAFIFRYVPLNKNTSDFPISDTVKLEVGAIAIQDKVKTAEEIKDTYTNVASSSKHVKILLVPGHEPNSGGTIFKNLKERDLNVELVEQMKNYLQTDSKIEVITARDVHNWNPVFSDYFDNNWKEIALWRDGAIDLANTLKIVGTSTETAPTVTHNTAPEDASIKLYGITKWANENDIDITIHVHFNDNPGRKAALPGKYAGFAIYLPSHFYDNGGSSRLVGNYVFERLRKYNSISNLEGESVGLIDEPWLIAIGEYNTAKTVTMLIEYNYIYEPQIVNSQTRNLVIKDMAYQTYLGLEDFLKSPQKAVLVNDFDTSLFPFTWNKQTLNKYSNMSEVLALQTALIHEDLYPPAGKNRTDCPRTGIVGPCTLSALEAFQQKYKIVGEKGVLGPQTVQVLHSRYGVKSDLR